MAPTLADGIRDEAADTSALPRYVQISESLKQRIATGLYPPDGSFPTEAELCSEFSASRFTVREAVRLLVECGMVSRRRGSGAFVLSAEPRRSYVQSMRSLTELFQYALDTEYEVKGSEIVTADAELADILVADSGSRWLRIDGLRWTKGRKEAICFTRVHAAARFAPLLHDLGAFSVPIYSVVEQRSGEAITEARQEIRAAAMPDDISVLLNQPPGGWSLFVTRHYLGRDGETMLCSMNWHPAESFRYTMRMQRDDAHF